MTRLKNPAYARRLIDERRHGHHPLEITVVYGERWWEAEQPKICLKPCDYEPGKYDFRAVAGCWVKLLDQDVGVCDVDTSVTPWAYGKFYDLIREIAAVDAYIEIHWPAKSRLASRPAHALASDHFTWDRARGTHVYPAWWSMAIDDQQTRRLLELAQDFQRVRGLTGAGCGAGQ